MKKALALIMALALCLGMVSLASAEGAVIRYWFWADTDEYAETMFGIIDTFNATNGKGITVEGERIPWDGGGYTNTLFTAAMGGGGPDAACWKLTATPQFVANDLLAPLDEYLADWEDYSQIEASLWDVMKSAGGGEQTFVMPRETQILYVYYRPSLFAAKGLEVPKTFDEFLNACAVLTGDGAYGFGMRGGNNGHEPWGSFIHARGGSFADMTSEGAVRGMQDFIDLYQKGYTPPTAPTDGFSQIIDNFKSGLTAMVVHHVGSYKGMVETFGDDVAAFVFPGDVGQWTSMGDTNSVIFESCQNKEAAFEWVSYLATGKGQEVWCEATGNVPVAQRVKELEVFQNNPFMKVSIEGAPYAGILPILDTTTEWVVPTWSATIQQALLGELTAAEAMEILQNELYK